VPYRLVGYVESTQATAGTWASSPSKIQGAGGVAMTIIQNPPGAKGYFQSTDQTITSGGSLTIAHGLGSEPVNIQAFLKAINAVLGYSVGDVTPVTTYITEATGRGQSIVPDATNLNIRISNVGAAFVINRKDTGAAATITNTDWSVFYRAWV
jgi:hypothetical protein